MMAEANGRRASVQQQQEAGENMLIGTLRIVITADRETIDVDPRSGSTSITVSAVPGDFMRTWTHPRIDEGTNPLAQQIEDLEHDLRRFVLRSQLQRDDSRRIERIGIVLQ